MCLLSVTLNLTCVELKHDQNVLHMFNTSIKYNMIVYNKHFTQLTSNTGQHGYDLGYVLVPVVSCCDIL